MTKFKIIVSDPETGTSKSIELEETRAAALIGRKVGELVEGAIVDMPGCKVRITGGSDKDGFPIRPSVHGGVRRRVLLSRGVGFNPKNEGMRKRKTIRGNVITSEIVQINLKVVEKPRQPEKRTKAKRKRKAETSDERKD